ncbi:MAG TPA: type II toxin-antitoxin system PemK/MazF family toxin [Chloroflexota bacterium]|nr:type II toxin-antitoxin system PemK/MazF family toxin [Chloroflexota bacterium]
MVGLVRGDVVVLPFPFSDLSAAKRRPALVVATLQGPDIILCQITSQATRDSNAISLGAGDFSDGSLRVASNIRPNRLFTADSRLVMYRAGGVTPAKLQEVVDTIIKVITT